MKLISSALTRMRQYPLLASLCRIVVGFLLSACQIGELYAPWALAAVACGGAGWPGVAYALGAVAGAFGFFDFQAGLRFGATAILIYCGALAFCGTALEKKAWYRPALAAVMLLLVQSVYLVGRELSATATCFVAAICTALCTFLWERIVHPEAAAPAESAAFSAQGGAAAFHALYDSFFSGTRTPRPENPSVLFDRAAEQVCQDCALCDRCWQSDYASTYDAFNSACPGILQRGEAQAADFPIFFSSRCLHFPALLSAVNSELGAFLLRRQYRGQLQETQEMAQKQYAQMGDLLERTHPVMAPRSAERIVYRTAYVLRPKTGERLCGDQVAAFHCAGAQYLLLSDGMGSGEAAHAESAMTVRLLQQFLSAGIEPLPSLQTINSALRLRGQNGGGYTTIDLLRLSTETPQATLYKYGAVGSYYKQGTQIQVLGGQSFPAGLENPDDGPDITSFALAEDAYVVLISDGITGGGGDGWLQALLRQWTGGTPDALARRILAESARNGAADDDCAVMVAHLEHLRENNSSQV